MNKEDNIIHCSECSISSEEVVLFDIHLPPTIKRSYLCRKCLDVAIDNSKKSMKGVT